MTALEERQQVVALVQEAAASGVRQAQACAVLGLSERTLQRWQDGEAVGHDQRPLRQYAPPHKRTETERAAVLAVANSAEFGHLPPSVNRRHIGATDCRRNGATGKCLIRDSNGG